jgi:hypothetical protein
MLLHMIIKILARELAFAHFILVLVRRNAVFFDSITVAVFNGLGDIGGVVRFVALARFCSIGGIRGGRVGRRGFRDGGRRGWRGSGGGGVVEGCGTDGGSCGEPRGTKLAHSVSPSFGGT